MVGYSKVRYLLVSGAGLVSLVFGDGGVSFIVVDGGEV